MQGLFPVVKWLPPDEGSSTQLTSAGVRTNIPANGRMHPLHRSNRLALPHPRKMNTRTELFRLNGAVERDPAVDDWMKEHTGELGAIAQKWFEMMRKCGDEVREVIHDGCPTACLGDAAFGYVNVFRSHVNVGFFQGASLPDPARLLQGTGKFMRRVKLKPGTITNAAALRRLIATAYSDMKTRVEHGDVTSTTKLARIATRRDSETARHGSTHGRT